MMGIPADTYLALEALFEGKILVSVNNEHFIKLKEENGLSLCHVDAKYLLYRAYVDVTESPYKPDFSDASIFNMDITEFLNTEWKIYDGEYTES